MRIRRHLTDLEARRPGATSQGGLYVSTDTNKVFQYFNGSWNPIGGGAGGGVQVASVSPAGGNGGMYFDSVSNLFRGYENGAWQDFVMAKNGLADNGLNNLNGLLLAGAGLSAPPSGNALYNGNDGGLYVSSGPGKVLGLAPWGGQIHSYGYHLFHGGLNIAGQLTINSGAAPANSSDVTGAAGDLRFDDNYIYIKSGTAGVGWRRAALVAF